MLQFCDRCDADSPLSSTPILPPMKVQFSTTMLFDLFEASMAAIRIEAAGLLMLSINWQCSKRHPWLVGAMFTMFVRLPLRRTNFRLRKWIFSPVLMSAMLV